MVKTVAKSEKNFLSKRGVSDVMFAYDKVYAQKIVEKMGNPDRSIVENNYIVNKVVKTDDLFLLNFLIEQSYGLPYLQENVMKNLNLTIHHLEKFVEVNGELKYYTYFVKNCSTKKVLNFLYTNFGDNENLIKDLSSNRNLSVDLVKKLVNDDRLEDKSGLCYNKKDLPFMLVEKIVNNIVDQVRMLDKPAEKIMSLEYLSRYTKDAKILNLLCNVPCLTQNLVSSLYLSKNILSKDSINMLFRVYSPYNRDVVYSESSAIYSLIEDENIEPELLKKRFYDLRDNDYWHNTFVYLKRNASIPMECLIEAAKVTEYNYNHSEVNNPSATDEVFIELLKNRSINSNYFKKEILLKLSQLDEYKQYPFEWLEELYCK